MQGNQPTKWIKMIIEHPKTMIKTFKSKKYPKLDIQKYHKKYPKLKPPKSPPFLLLHTAPSVRPRPLTGARSGPATWGGAHLLHEIASRKSLG